METTKYDFEKLKMRCRDQLITANNEIKESKIKYTSLNEKLIESQKQAQIFEDECINYRHQLKKVQQELSQKKIEIKRDEKLIVETIQKETEEEVEKVNAEWEDWKDDITEQYSELIGDLNDKIVEKDEILAEFVVENEKLKTELVNAQDMLCEDMSVSTVESN